MKKMNLYCLVLIVLCLAVLWIYQALDSIRTDTTPPDITVRSEALEISMGDDVSVLLEGVTALDKEDGDVTPSLVVESVRLLDKNGTCMVTYAAFDSSGNVRKVSRNFCYRDYQSPSFSLSKPLVFLQNSHFDVLNVISASDMQDGDISHRIRATSVDGTSIAIMGEHEVEFRVSNSLGDTTKLVLPVEVYPSGLYNATLTLKDYLIYLDEGASFNPQYYLDSFSRGAVVIPLSGNLPSGFSVAFNGKVDTNTPGVYNVAYTVTYSADGQSYTGYSKLIVVVEG